MPSLTHTTPDHDETLIARLAVDDFVAGDRDRDRATTQAAECPACAELLADLRTIVTATAALPAPRRTRDFKLTEADAARLRPGGWKGVLARLGSPSFAFTRPLAAGLATLGIAGLLLTSLPAGLGGSAASLPESALAPAAGNAAGAASNGTQDTAGSNPSAAPAPAFAQPGASGRDAAASPALPPLAVPPGGVGVTSEDGEGAKASSSAGPGIAAAPNPSPSEANPAPSEVAGGSSPGGASPVALVSIVLLVAGLGLWVLRMLARRLA